MPNVAVIGWPFHVPSTAPCETSLPFTSTGSVSGVRRASNATLPTPILFGALRSTLVNPCRKARSTTCLSRALKT
jgi:hypothetical protein